MNLDRYVVAGNPVEHSRSPAIHAAFARQTGQALEYGRLLCPLDGFAATVRGFAAEPGARGCNVTVPFKFEAWALAGKRTPRAELAGAVNTLRFDGNGNGDTDGWLGDNTDGIGLVRDVEGNAGVAIAGARVLVIGAGGGAAGAVGALLGARPAELVIANRTVDKARELAARHAGVSASTRLAAAPLADCGRGFDLVVNATATSLQGGLSPVGAEVLRPGTLVLDMMYGAAARPFLAWAASHGATGRDGLGMLIEQAAEAFLLWRGVRPATAEVLADLRRRVDEGRP
jgi:shikimate dehydrogenase